MAGYRDFRGVCDITEDGMGGFTMDSVYSSVINGEKYVTSVFRLKSEVDTEGKRDWKEEEIRGEKAKGSKEGWNPKNFNFKAAVGGSTSQRKSSKKEAPGKIKEIHQSKKVGSRKARKGKISQVKKQLDGAFEDPHSDVLKEVANIVEEGGFDELERCLQQDHGEDCKCGEHIKEMVDFYESQGISILDYPEKENQNSNIETKDKDQELRKEVSEAAVKETNGEEGSKEKEVKEYDEEELDWVCREYVRKVTEFYDSIDSPGSLSFEDIKRAESKEENQKKEATTEGIMKELDAKEAQEDKF